MINTATEYRFSYVTTRSIFKMEGQDVLVQIGPFVKKRFAFANIINYYVFENQSYRSLFITYYDDNGKQKKVQLFSQLGEIGFRDLVEFLNQTIGQKSLNHLPEKEAFAVMKTFNPKKWGAALAFGIMFAILSVLFFPTLYHFFDFGFADAEVQQLISGDAPSTKNLNLSGVPIDAALEVTTSKGSSTTGQKVYVPIVPPEWTEDEPVKCFLQFNEITRSEYDNGVLETSEFVGVVRDVWYEGLASDEKQFFVDEYGLNVPDDVILFEVTGEQHNDTLMFFVWLGVLLFLGVLFLIMYFKQKRQSS
jgi:hypothetical protein